MIKNKVIDILKVKEIITFDEFMHLCLNHEEFGYYRSINPFGSTGDFITSPEISQIFGEIIALWIADTWLKMGSPNKLNLIELGAGKGTLLSDILRVLLQIPDIVKSFNIHILEINRTLIEEQKQSLKDYKKIITWHEKVEDLPSNHPTIIYSNEFFDAIPTKQYIYDQNEWYELCVCLNENKRELQYVYNKASLLNINYPLLQNLEKQIDKTKPFVYEISNLGNSIFLKLADIIKKNNGAIITIDYGYTTMPNRSTLRGYKNHKLFTQQELLANFESTDITYNVNFVNLQNIASNYGLQTYNILLQKDFLKNLGIVERTKQLIHTLEKQENYINKEESIKSLEKSTDTLINPKEMGEIFKVMAVSFGIDNLSCFTKNN